MAMEDKAVCGIAAVIKATRMRRDDILAHIEAGKIMAEKRGRQIVFEIAEKDRLISLRDTYVGFFHIAQNYLDENGTFRLNRRKCRDGLLDFVVESAWFGADAVPSESVFFADTRSEAYFVRKNDEHLLASHIRLWIASYGKSPEHKLALLLDRIQEHYPATGSLLRKFLKDEYPSDHTAAWILTDFLCHSLSHEITQSDDKALERTAARADNELPLNSARMFSAFLAYLRNKRKLGNGWTYQFQSRGESQENGAYPATAFLRMAYIIFNEDAWEIGRLKEKALRSEPCANLWLFVAAHFVCGWRGTDIVRLPMPCLPCCGTTMREQLSSGGFDTDSLLYEVEQRLLYAPMKPSKTKSYNVPELKLSTAESLRTPFGFILSVAASHHEDVRPGGAFIRRAGAFTEIQNFFGNDFLLACESRGFNTRRANKSYLQGIEATADDSPGKPKGYMLAALARSHKGGYGALPKTTEIYLRDARFSGYSPEFIAREMFERGVFSFIPALLLDMYEGGNKKRLPVAEQSKLIAEIGVSPSGLEGLASTVQHALFKARKAVAEIMTRPLEMRGSVDSILQNIASGSAPGRQGGFLCLMTAAGYACTDPDRSCCIGCGFEIYTKTILRLLLSEYSRLLERKRASGEDEVARCEAILKKAVLPAITEMLLSTERLYPDADMRPMLEDLKGGFDNADS